MIENKRAYLINKGDHIRRPCCKAEQNSPSESVDVKTDAVVVLDEHDPAERRGDGDVVLGWTGGGGHGGGCGEGRHSVGLVELAEAGSVESLVSASEEVSSRFAVDAERVIDATYLIYVSNTTRLCPFRLGHCTSSERPRYQHRHVT